MMKLTILGSGTYVPTKDRGPAGYWLEAGPLNVLIDAGSGTLQRMVRAGKDYMDIDVIIVSHLHPDHVSDLAALFHIMYGCRFRSRKKPLVIIGGKGYRAWHRKAQGFFSKWPREGGRGGGRVQVCENISRKKIQGVYFSFAPGNHHPSSILVKVMLEGITFGYTGDTGYDDALARFFKGTDTLVCECNSPEGRRVDGHLTPSGAAILAAQACVRHLIVSHLSPDVLKTPLRREIKKHFSSTVTVARDLLSVRLPAQE